MGWLTYYSAGFPKIMHIIGDAAFWADRDGTVDKDDAVDATLKAAETIGRQYVDPSVYAALRSEDYRSILAKIGGTGLGMTIRKSEVAKLLTEGEKKKLANFLRRMRTLHVIQPGGQAGEYVFCSRMVRVYIWLTHKRRLAPSPAS
jgi:hypothetical protein